MTDKSNLDRCAMTEDGFCPMHEVEVERRRNSRKEIEDIKADIVRTRGHIGNLLTFMNNINGQRTVIGGVALLIVLGSYSYTFITANAINVANHRYERLLEAKERAYQTDLQGVRTRLSALDTGLAVIDERYRTVVAQLRNLNDSLSQLLWVINEERTVDKISLQEVSP